MRKIAPPKIRLSDTSVEGAEVYNFYQMISQLSSIYVKAIDRRDNAELSALWDTCASSILTQIGIAHECWGHVQSRKNSGIPMPVQETLVKRSQVLAKRLYRIDSNLTEWLGADRWSRILLSVERQLQNFGLQLIATDPFLLEPITSMGDYSDSRVAILESIASLVQHENESLTRNFAIPVVL